MRSTICRPAALAALGAVVLACGGGCASMSNTAKGVGVGAGVGAGLGALVGSVTGDAGSGAAIGAAAGGLLGGVVGNDMDMQEKEKKDAQLAQAQAQAAAASARPPLSLQEVAQMAQEHVSDAVIINTIRTTRTAYTLSGSDIIWLKQSGVSDSVILELQTAKSPVAQASAVQPVVVRQPVYVAEPVYVMPPPQPVGMSYSYTYVGGMHRR